METSTPEQRISPEAARELLMAISQSIPDKEPVTTQLPKNSMNTDVFKRNGSSGAEEYRSRLISISYTEPTDMKLFSSPLESFNTYSTDAPVIEFSRGGAMEECRSKLISISYTLSPDMKFLPFESLTA